MNTLSIVASFGALVWIFQDGNLSAPLGFQPLGFVETTQPVILFCVLFGLSMDYEVFLLSRMKEAWDRTGDNTEAVARGLERSGRIVSLGGADRGRGGRLVRVRRHRADQGAGPRRRDRGRPRRDGRPGAARAGDDAAARPLELVDARRGSTGRSAGCCRAPRPRSRRRRDEARLARSSSWPSSPLVVAGCGGPVLANPPAPHPVLTPRAHGVAPPRGPASRRPPARRRPARPPDRVVVRHGPPARGRRAAVRLRVRRLPRRARRLPGLVGLAPRAHRRDRRALPLRPAERDRAAGGPVAAGRRRAARVTSFAGSTRRRARRTARPGRCRAVAGRTTCTRRRDGRRGRRATRSSRSGSTSSSTARKPAGPPRRRRLRRLRAGRRLVLLLADRHGGHRHGHARRRDARGRAATPGSTTSGATSSRSAAAAGTGSRSTSTTARTSRCRSSAPRTAPTRWSTGRSSTPTASTRHLAARRLHRRRDRRAGRAPRPARPTPPAGRSDPAARTWRSDLAPTVAQQELDTRATTGVVYWEGSQRGDGDARRHGRWAARPTSS